MEIPHWMEAGISRNLCLHNDRARLFLLFQFAIRWEDATSATVGKHAYKFNLHFSYILYIKEKSIMRLPHHRQCHILHRTINSNSRRKAKRREEKWDENSTTYTQSDYFIIKLFHCTASQPTDFHQIRHKFYVFRRKTKQWFLPSRKKEEKRHEKEKTQHVTGCITCSGVERASIGSNRSSVIKSTILAWKLKSGGRKNYWAFPCFSLHTDDERKKSSEREDGDGAQLVVEEFVTQWERNWWSCIKI